MRYLAPLLVAVAIPCLAGQPAPTPAPIPQTDVSVQVNQTPAQTVGDIVRYETRTRIVQRPETYTEMVPVTKTRMVDVEEEYQVAIREIECDPCATQVQTIAPPCDDCTSVNVNAVGPAGGNVDVSVRRKGFFQRLLEKRRNRSMGTSVNVRY